MKIPLLNFFKCVLSKIESPEKIGDLDRIFRQLSIAFWCVTLLLVALVLCAHTLVAFPVGDDYGRANCASIHHAFERTVRDYFNWSGRWAGLLIQYVAWVGVSASDVQIGIAYSICLLTLMGCLVVVGASIMRMLFSISRSKALFWFLIPSIVYLSFINEPGQVLLWLPGLSEGGLAVACFIWIAWSCAEIARSTPSQISKARLAVTCLVALVCAGFHELGGMAVCAYLTLFAAYQVFIFRKTVNGAYYVVLAVAIIGLGASVFAPGNAIRASQELGQSGSIPHALNAISIILLRFLKTVLSPVPIFSGIMLVWFLSSRVNQFTALSKDPKMLRGILVCSSVALFAVAVVVCIKTGKIPAGRTVSFFCSGWLGVAFPALILGLIPRIKTPSLQIPSWVFVVAGLGIISGPTLDKGLFSFKLGMVPWLQYQNLRHSILTDAGQGGEISVTLDPSPPKPPLLFTEYELTSDPDSFGNTIQASYYGVDRIKVVQKFTTSSLQTD